MGSLTSKPKAPKQPKVVYVPATAPPPAATDPQTGPTPEEAAAAARTQSLLSRSRGRFGTIQTGFRGLLLGPGDNNERRKTLLGE
jgi:hypothetical protein